MKQNNNNWHESANNLMNREKFVFNNITNNLYTISKSPIKGTFE